MRSFSNWSVGTPPLRKLMSGHAAYPVSEETSKVRELTQEEELARISHQRLNTFDQ